MPKSFKTGAVITLILSVLFYVFFQTTKQNAALAPVNPFAEDPYDAVGSFAIQLALLTAFLSLIRAFRPYQTTSLENAKLLLMRTEMMSILSVAVTLVADMIAMLRFSTLWRGSTAGQTLLTYLVVMLILTAFAGWFIYRLCYDITLPPIKQSWLWLMLPITGFIILTLYPVNWRETIGGAIFTVIVGIIILFVSVRVILAALMPYQVETDFEDTLDDFTAVYSWLKAKSRFFDWFDAIVGRIKNVALVNRIAAWLNPRNHQWNAILLVGICLGALLTLIEIFGEGGSPEMSQLMLVITIFIGLECAGVLIGYGLLAKPLGLFRQNESTKIEAIE